MWDVLSGVDALIAKGMVDGARMGSMGWSQGGYISAFLTTNTDRFKAISVGAGISDWTTYYVNTDITPFTRQYLHATPWEDPKIYAATSPMTNIRKAKTPTLIQHGDSDKRVPPPNSFELYRGLVDAGVPARLILYKGFSHPITKPKSNRAVLQHNLDWFGHYVFGEPILRGRRRCSAAGSVPAPTEGRSAARRHFSRRIFAVLIPAGAPNAASKRLRTPRSVTRVARVVPESIPSGIACSTVFFSSACSAARTSSTNAAGGDEPGRQGVAQPGRLRVDREVCHPQDVLGLRRGGLHPGDPFDVGGASAGQEILRASPSSLYSCRRR